MPRSKSLAGGSCAQGLAASLIKWEREQVQTEDAARWLLADSSPQHGFNYYAMIEDRVSWLAGVDAKGLVRLDPRAAFTTRCLPLCALGYGGASIAYKLVATIHVCCFETGSVRSFHKTRRKVFGWTSDMGVEMYVADGPCILLQDLATFEDLAARVEARQLDCADPGGADAFLFPKAIFVGDFLHQVFGCLDEVVQSLPMWQDMERMLRDLSQFLSDKELRTRFQATCFREPGSAVEKHMFDAWSGGHVSWRWQHLEKFVLKLIAFFPVLQRRFGLQLLSGAVPDLSKIHTQVLNSVQQALHEPQILPLCWIIHSISAELGAYRSVERGLQLP